MPDPSAPLKRTPFRVSSVRLPRSQLRPTRRVVAKPSRQRDNGPSPAVVAAVLERDGHACALCGGAAHGQRGVDFSVHHRKLRSQGGDSSFPNLITLCGSGTTGHHGWAHAHPKAAKDDGWIVPGAVDPALRPIAHWLHGTVWLHADGGYGSRPEAAA